MEKHNDRPRDEILIMADKAIRTAESKGSKAKVYFKFTCAHYGERKTFVEPNILYENGECYCGKTTKLDKAGFMLVIDLQ